jgi:hypothetical protein
VKNESIKRCCCCSRQIVSNVVGINDKYCCNVPATRMWSDQWCCKECSKDLDENGLFPEERQ